MVAYAYAVSIWGRGVEGPEGLEAIVGYNEFETSLGYMKPCFEKSFFFFKCFYTTKEIINRTRGESKGWEKYVKCLSNRGVIHRTYKELKRLNSEKGFIQLMDGLGILTDSLQMRMYKWPVQTGKKICSTLSHQGYK